jgi:thiosulfate/3-mercaptopyruvate sulfurtransferase
MTTDISSRGYAHPQRLVSTDWVAAHADDPNVKVIESDEDVLLYDTGHVPGSIKLDWVADLNDPVRRDYLDRSAFEAKMRELGIRRDDTLVFYGDKNNWWACYALWVFELFGHPDLRIMDGGRAKWQAEGRPMTTERPSHPMSDYVAPERDDSMFRAFRDRVMRHVDEGGKLIDVRSPDEFSGKKLHMPE